MGIKSLRRRRRTFSFLSTLSNMEATKFNANLALVHNDDDDNGE
jgi:hypothetical protein